MQRCAMHPEWMPWIACSVGQCIQVGCSGIHAACSNGYRLNALYSLQHCVIDTNWAVDSMHQDSMQWIQCSVVNWMPSECSGFHAVWPNGSRLNSVDSMQRYWMQWILCRWCSVNPLNEADSMQLGRIDTDWMQWIPCSVIECTAFHAALCNAFRVNEVDCMQLGPMDPDWMQWIPWSTIECSGFYAEWCNVSRLNEVD